MKYFHVMDTNDGIVGVFATERTDDGVQADITKCFEMAVEMEQKDPTIDLYDAAETYLEDRGIWKLLLEWMIVETD